MYVSRTLQATLIYTLDLSTFPPQPSPAQPSLTRPTKPNRPTNRNKKTPKVYRTKKPKREKYTSAGWGGGGWGVRSLNYVRERKEREKERERETSRCRSVAICGYRWIQLSLPRRELPKNRMDVCMLIVGVSVGLSRSLAAAAGWSAESPVCGRRMRLLVLRKRRVCKPRRFLQSAVHTHRMEHIHTPAPRLPRAQAAIRYRSSSEPKTPARSFRGNWCPR